MTREELENRKLERRAKEWLIKDKGGSIIKSLVNLIKEFTEPREKRIAELEAQIEKMKKRCCEPSEIKGTVTSMSKNMATI